MAKARKTKQPALPPPVPVPVPDGIWGCRACATVNQTKMTCPRNKVYVSYRDHCDGCNEPSFVVIDRDGTVKAVLINPIL